MTNRKANRVLATLATVLVFFLVRVVESRGGAATGPADYIEGVVTSSNGPEAGGRGVGDSRNHGPADEVHQDCRHRRSWTLCFARTAAGELPGLRAWLRLGGFGPGSLQT